MSFFRSGTLLRLACVMFLLAVGVAVAGDEPEDPRIEQIRRRLDALMATHARGYIDEQAGAADRADAALVVGALYETGAMGEPNPVEAERFYREAAEAGCADADAALARLYMVGAESKYGRVAKNVELAIEHYEKAADAGSVAAMATLGDIYNEGTLVPSDSKKALNYYMSAATRGEGASLQRLEPVMRQAREWEEAKPGRKANFPTRAEDVVNSELARETNQRAAKMDRLASRTYVELNKRIGASAQKD